MTKTAIPFEQPKPRRAKRWVLLNLPLLLLVIGLCSLATHSVLRLNHIQYTSFENPTDSSVSYHFSLTPKAKRLLQDGFEGITLSEEVPFLMHDILKDAKGTLSIHTNSDTVIAASYTASNGELIILGDQQGLVRASKRYSFIRPHRAVDTQGDQRVKIRKKFLEIKSASTPYIKEPLLLPEVQIESVYNQSSLRLIQGIYNDTTFFHLTTPSSETTSALDFTAQNLLLDQSLSTLVSTDDYSYRTREVIGQDSQLETSESSISSIKASDGTNLLHLISGSERSIVTNLPIEQALYTNSVSQSSCLKRAHSFRETAKPSRNNRYFTDVLSSRTAQSKGAIRVCF